jgi:hypothetical protein
MNGQNRVLRACGAGLLSALCALAFSAVIEVQTPYVTYGSVYNPVYMGSELDRESAERKANQEAKRTAAVDRMSASSEERRNEAVQRNQRHYVPKPSTPSTLIVRGPDSQVTVDRVMSSVVSSQASRSAVPVEAPPLSVEGKSLIMSHDEFYYYGDGIFYILNGDELAEVPAPDGALVEKLPAGFEVLETASGRLYKSNGTYYQRVMVSGFASFKVVTAPKK